MMLHRRRWIMQASLLLCLGIICCLGIAAMGSIPEYKWLAALLAVTAFVLLRVLGLKMND